MSIKKQIGKSELKYVGSGNSKHQRSGTVGETRYGQQRRKSSLTCFLLRERKCIVSLPAVAVGLKGVGEARGGLPFCNIHASMVKREWRVCVLTGMSLRVEGLRPNSVRPAELTDSDH